MKKFSIIIPVYNVEKYLEKCLHSVFTQTFLDFEVVIINDGSTDKSSNIIKEYKKKYKNIKVIEQENQGLSVARNNGIEQSSGEYFLLLDSDDYIDKDLLLKLNRSIENTPDLVRYQFRVVENDKKQDYNQISFEEFSGEEAFNVISKFKFVEPACCYLYKKEYFINNKFLFEPNVYHEDFGLIPLVIIKANKVNCIDYIGYNYVKREGSITTSSEYTKIVKKAYDALKQYKKIIQLDNDKIYRSFLANSVILKLNDLKGKEYKKYLFELKKEKVFNNILSDTLSRKIKKLILIINPKLYFKMR